METREIKEVEEAADDFVEEEHKYKYIAFISYRHLEPDATIAKNIHTMIETFKLPKEFYEDGKSPNFRVFRDREELASASLGDSIDQALRTSKFLVVICSKRLKKSEWCVKEVETFVKLHGIDRVIPVLVEGEPSESFPEILLNHKVEVLNDEGEKQLVEKELLAAELRTEEVLNPSFEGYEKLEVEKNPKLKELTNKAVKLLKTEKYRIMAAILGVSYGDLKQRDKERRTRRMLILSAIVSSALLFFLIFMYNAYKNENIAKKQTVQDKATFMLNEASNNIKEGDRFKSILLSKEAMKDIEEDMPKYKELKAQHFAILNDTVNVNKASYNSVIKTDNEYTYIDTSKDSKYVLAGLGNDSIGLWDVKTGLLSKSLKGHSQQVMLANFSNNSKYIVSGGFDDVINVWSSTDYKKIASKKTPGNIMLANFSVNDKNIHVMYDTMDSYFYQKYDTNTLKEIGKPIPLNYNIKRIIIDKNDNYMWLINQTYEKDSSLIKVNLATGDIIKTYKDDRKESQISVDKKGNIIENKKSILNYRFIDFKPSKRDNIAYLTTGKSIIKLDLNTDKEMFRIDGLFLNEKLDFNIVESPKKDFIYYSEGAKLFKADFRTGETIEEWTLAENEITSMDISEDGSKVAILDTNNEIYIIQDGDLLDKVSNLSKDKIDIIRITDDGNYIATLSQASKKIKLLSTNIKEGKTQVINGQIAGVSENKKYTLYINSGKYFLWDNEKNKKVKDISHPYFGNSFVLGDGQNAISISNDGRYISSLERTPDENTKKKVYVLDTESAKEIYSFIPQLPDFYYGFSNDGSHIIIQSKFNEISIHSVKEKRLVKTIEVARGSLKGFNMSDDNKYIAVNYREGVSHVYDIKTGKDIGSLPGNIIFLGSDKNGRLEMVTIYNNIAQKYLDFKQEGEDIKLSEERVKLGDTQSERNVYNHKNGLLLTTRSEDKKHTVYLIDFTNGDLIKTFNINLASYTPRGFISSDGKKVVIDISNTVFINDKGEYVSRANTAIYKIEDYETLNKKAMKAVEGLKLDDESKIILEQGK